MEQMLLRKGMWGWVLQDEWEFPSSIRRGGLSSQLAVPQGPRSGHADVGFGLLRLADLGPFSDWPLRVPSH